MIFIPVLKAFLPKAKTEDYTRNTFTRSTVKRLIFCFYKLISVSLSEKSKTKVKERKEYRYRLTLSCFRHCTGKSGTLFVGWNIGQTWITTYKEIS
jgi:hypothetical protein